jgi:pimeloyl-ACP methyl ester carboxylesterase
MKKAIRAADIHGYSRLAIDATLGLADLVETMHRNVADAPGVLGKASQQRTKGITGFVYRSVRGVTRLVGASLDTVLGRLAPLLGSVPSSRSREAVIAALNGVLGDHLAASRNPLAIRMQLRRDGRPLELPRQALAQAIPRATGRVLVLVHGLCMNDLQWRRNGHDHGARLALDSGYTPVYLHYNSGLCVDDNGRAFAGLLEELLKAWPVRVEELAIVAHSMGGLVSRSACHHGRQLKQAWPRRLRSMVFLGTPHHGAPLERAGNWIDIVLGASPYTTAFARLGKVRSAGINDLRHGRLLQDDGETPLPLPKGVRCYAVAASVAARSGELRGQLLGDGLVPLRSALGQHPDPERDLAFPAARTWVGYGMNHMQLLERRGVYAQVKKWLA